MAATAMAGQHLLHQGQELQPSVLPEHFLQGQKENPQPSKREGSTDTLPPGLAPTPTSNLPVVKPWERPSGYSRGNCSHRPGDHREALSPAFGQNCGNVISTGHPDAPSCLSQSHEEGVGTARGYLLLNLRTDAFQCNKS